MTNGTRCVVVVDEALAPGLAANAAAVVAMTLGTRVPELLGEDYEDGGGSRHAGLCSWNVWHADARWIDVGTAAQVGGQ